MHDVGFLTLVLVLKVERFTFSQSVRQLQGVPRAINRRTNHTGKPKASFVSGASQHISAPSVQFRISSKADDTHTDAMHAV